MIRHVGTLSVYILASFLGAGLFFTSQHVQIAERDLAHLREEIAVKNDTLKILRAEWAYLNRPDRLEGLAETYLDMSPSSPRQIYMAISEIPETAPVVTTDIKFARDGLRNRIVAEEEAGKSTPEKSAQIAAAITPAAGGNHNVDFSNMLNRLTEKKGDQP